jgi:hypothetical protein
MMRLLDMRALKGIGLWIGRVGRQRIGEIATRWQARPLSLRLGRAQPLANIRNAQST